MAKEKQWQGPHREAPEGVQILPMVEITVDWVSLAKAISVALVAGSICAQGRSQNVDGSVALAREIVNKAFDIEKKEAPWGPEPSGAENG